MVVAHPADPLLVDRRVRPGRHDDRGEGRVPVGEGRLVRPDPVAGAVDRVEVHCRADLGHLRAVDQVLLDRRVGQLGDVEALPVAADTRREQRVERGVQRRVRQRGDHLGHDRCHVAEGLHRALALLQRPGPVHDGDGQGVAVPVGRDELQRRGDLEAREAAVRLGRVPDELPEEAQQVPGRVELVEEDPDVDVVDRVQRELEGGDDPEVAAAAAQRPEQLRVLLPAGHPDLSVGGDHVRGDQVVHSEAVAAVQVADPAAQGQPADPGGGHDPARGGQTVGVRGVVDVSPGRAAGHAGPPGGRVDAHVPHRRQVDHQPAVVGAEPGSAVAAAAHGQLQTGVPGEIHRRHHVGGLLRADDGGRAPVEHAVVDAPGLVVGRIVCGDHAGTDLVTEAVDRRFGHGVAPSLSAPRPE